MSIRLYVGNLPRELQRQEFEAVFADDSESIVSVKLIADRKTGKCRGFGFVTVKSDELADTLVEKYNGYLLQDTSLKVEKALPRAKEGTETVAEVSSSNNGGSNSRRSNKKTNRKSGGSAAASGSASESEAVRPDPRWAQELEKLKELLAAQTTAS
jgi:RNA recognition motif-containing protein